MHRYRIEFTAQTLDETRLRAVLEREFGISSVSILREAAAHEPHTVVFSPRSPIYQDILQLLANNKPWRRKALIQELDTSGEGKLQISRALTALEEKGVVRKLQHGVYALAGIDIDDAEIEPLSTTHERRSETLALEYLKEPRTAPFLRDSLGITRQRVDQIVKKLMEVGKVKRVESMGENGGFLYVRSEALNAASIMQRAPSLRGNRVRILSALAPETTAKLSDISEVGSVSPTNISRYIESLEAQGLVTSFELGKNTYITITPRGLQHPQYNSAFPKAHAADIPAEYGEERIRFIETVSVLGTAKTVDITDALYRDDETPAKSGQVVQRLQNMGIFEANEDAGESGHRSYRLTTYGQLIANVVAKARPRPTLESLQERIAYRRNERISRLRSRNAEAGHPFGSPASASIVAALEKHGPLLTSQLHEKMDVRFQNPRSINLALRTLAERGAVECVGELKKEKIWALKAIDAAST
jgi:predicted transcriptional regulator